jgi:hypothetical protein
MWELGQKEEHSMGGEQTGPIAEMIFVQSTQYKCGSKATC